VRCLCSDGPDPQEDLEDAQQAAGIIAKDAGLGLRVLPVRSVGVQGDFRTYAHPALVWGDADWSALGEVSTRITNAVRDVNRVIYLLAPDRIEQQRLKRSFLARPRLDLLRQADALAMKALLDAGLAREVSQMPTVLAPLTTDGYQEAIVLRPVVTPDFMTARFAELPRDLLNDLAADLLVLDGVEAVCYDVTHKPPGTVEWE
jgi:GMP synthase (glutamine-hydrolysing)